MVAWKWVSTIRFFRLQLQNNEQKSCPRRIPRLSRNDLIRKDVFLKGVGRRVQGDALCITSIFSIILYELDGQRSSFVEEMRYKTKNWLLKGKSRRARCNTSHRFSFLYISRIVEDDSAQKCENLVLFPRWQRNFYLSPRIQRKH